MCGCCVQVAVAYDGQDAYDEIVARGGPDAFDVILMDLHMPRKVLPCPSMRSSVSASEPVGFAAILCHSVVQCASLQNSDVALCTTAYCHG